MRRPSARNLVLLLVALAAALGLAEAGLRVAGFRHASLYRHDPHRGWALRPGLAVQVSTEAGPSLVRTSSAGLRDREHAPDKPAGTVRIAILGDSFAEALQVPVERTFWSVLERELGRCPGYAGRTVETMNFGVGGYGTAQALLTLRHEARRYRPDLVLLAFYTENDVLNNARATNPTRPDEAPYFVYQGDRLVLDEPPSGLARAYRRAAGAVADRAARLRLVQLVHAALRGRTQRAEQQAQQRRLAALGVPDPVAMPYLAPAHPELIQAWRVTEGLLVALRDEARAQGAALWIATLSNAPQVYPDPDARAAFMRRAGVEDLYHAERRIQALGEREGIPVIALAPAMVEHADRHRVFLHGFPASKPGMGHWNEAGHRLAGELIAARLCGAPAPPRP